MPVCVDPNNCAINISPIEKQAGFVKNFTIAEVVATIFQVIINLSAAIFLLMLLYGGFTYLTAGSNEESTEKAKKIMLNALVGLIIVTAAYGIGTWILNALGVPTSI